MIDTHLRTVRAAITRHQNLRARRNVGFPAGVRRAAVVYARQHRAAGASLHRIATDLGVATNTLDRWLRIDPEKKFRPVTVVRPAGATKPVLVLHGRGGVRVEGLDPEGVAAILRTLA